MNILKNKNLAMQSAILAITAIIVRIIGAIYKIPLINILGNKGMSYYSSSYVIYEFILVVSTLSIPIAVSKIVSEKLLKNEHKNAHRVFSCALLLAGIIGGISASIIWIFADAISIWINSPFSTYSLKVLAPTIFIVAIMGVFRGYFQGMNTMIPSSLSIFVEQITNAVVSIVAAKILVKRGVEYGAAGGTIGTAIGATAGLLIIVGIYTIFRFQTNTENNDETDESMYIVVKRIIYTVIPMIVSTSIFYIINFIDMAMLMKALGKHGYSYNQIANLNGMYSSKYMVIIFLPIAVSSSLIAPTVPSISASYQSKNRDMLCKKVNMIVKFTSLVTIPSCVGVFVLASPVTLLLFNDKSDLLISILKLGSITIIFYSLATILTAILQSINYSRKVTIYIFASLFLKIISNYILLYIFDTNLYGAIISNIIFSATLMILNYNAFRKKTNISIEIKRNFIIPITLSIIMGMILYLTYNISVYLTSISSLSTIIAINVSIIVYVACALLLKEVSLEEIRSLNKDNI